MKLVAQRDWLVALRDVLSPMNGTIVRIDAVLVRGALWTAQPEDPTVHEAPGLVVSAIRPFHSGRG